MVLSATRCGGYVGVETFFEDSEVSPRVKSIKQEAMFCLTHLEETKNLQSGVKHQTGSLGWIFGDENALRNLHFWFKRLLPLHQEIRVK